LIHKPYHEHGIKGKTEKLSLLGLSCNSFEIGRVRRNEDGV
jgi:hypothetical protein